MSARDPYAAAAGAYDLFTAADRPEQLGALERLLPLLRPDIGPILDVGAGSGLNSALILDRLPDARVYALEPSPAMRSLALSRIADHPQWFERVTVRPEDFFSAPLPELLGGAVLMGVIGHFDEGERAAVLAELAARLPGEGAALIDLPSPEPPTRVDAYEFTAARIGELSYRGIAEAWPVDAERMRWRMTYLTLDGERVLVEDTTDHEYRHPHPDRLAGEAAQVGLALHRLDRSRFWLLTRT